jgi:hypothetical protein
MITFEASRTQMKRVDVYIQTDKQAETNSTVLGFRESSQTLNVKKLKALVEQPFQMEGVK